MDRLLANLHTNGLGVSHLHPLPTFVDEDLLKYDEIWAAAGGPFAVFVCTPGFTGEGNPGHLDGSSVSNVN